MVHRHISIEVPSTPPPLQPPYEDLAAPVSMVQWLESKLPYSIIVVTAHLHHPSRRRPHVWNSTSLQANGSRECGPDDKLRAIRRSPTIKRRRARQAIL